MGSFELAKPSLTHDLTPQLSYPNTQRLYSTVTRLAAAWSGAQVVG